MVEPLISTPNSTTAVVGGAVDTRGGEEAIVLFGVTEGEPAIWLADGDRWNEVHRLDSGELPRSLRDMAIGDSGFVAIGSVSMFPTDAAATLEPLVLHSADGETWAQVTLPYSREGVITARDVIWVDALDRYLMAIDHLTFSETQNSDGGRDFQDAGITILESVDGIAWEPSEPLAQIGQSETGLGPSSLGLVAQADGAVLLGFEENKIVYPPARLASWATSDGTTWDAATHDDTGSGDGIDTEFRNVEHWGGNLCLIRTRATNETRPDGGYGSFARISKIWAGPCN